MDINTDTQSDIVLATGVYKRRSVLLSPLGFKGYNGATGKRF